MGKNANEDAIAWGSIENPVLSLPDHAVKDAYAVRGDDGWHLGFSFIQDDPFRFRVGTARASRTFEDVELGEIYDDDAVGGLASPTVVKAPDGTYVMTYNSHTTDVDGTANKLYFRTSNDLVTWSAARRIVVDGANGPDDRVIDGAIAFAGDDVGAFLFFKREQAANVAHAPSGRPEGPWTLLGEIDPLNLENCQAIEIDGVWHLLGTTIPIDHRAVLHRLDGDARDPLAWRTWTPVGELVVPAEEWNTGPFPGSEKSNAAFLIDERDVDGFFYLLYAGSTELGTFEGRGHAKLGLARSPNLASWQVP